MTEHSLHSAHGRFREARELLAEATPEAFDREGMGSGLLAVGLLIGGGFPGAGAVVSVLMEHRWPGGGWPWSGGAA